MNDKMKLVGAKEESSVKQTRVGEVEEVRIIKIVTPPNEPGFRRFYEVSDDNSPKERALTEVELEDIYDQVANKIQDFKQFGPNEAKHPHSMAEYEQFDKERKEKLKLGKLIPE